MTPSFFSRLFGSYNDKQVQLLRTRIPAIRAHQERYTAMSHDDLRAQFADWRATLTADPTQTDTLLEPIFGGIVAAAAKLDGHTYDVKGKTETWRMVHYDVQLIGGTVLHQGKIAEMKTGEGKTLSSTLPIILNALTGKGVHVVTVNDYLASRDAEWMKPLYDFCGLTVGIITNATEKPERKAQYAADITYGTNNEFGFDYLRDNMAQNPDQLVQRELHFAIVDEVDSILIDEARTPLIISAPAEESTEKYRRYAQLIPQLVENEHYNIELRTKAVTLSDAGIAKMEQLLGVQNIYTEAGFDEVHHIENALKAQVIFEKEKDYILQDDKVVIVDEFTGRLMPGRRYGDGLHQALEAKEGVTIQRESKTLATVTFQNYFRLYEKLSGMTGTAETEAEEFAKIYTLDTIVIPTHRPIARKDLADKIFKNARGKYISLAKDVRALHEKGQPVLIGTVSIEKSEVLSELLRREAVPHEVLNAKQHEREADIVAKAGQKGAVTIATNMAGRGTDIKITDEVRDLGGLAILGTERHESRRIDNQLRGRAGRQGDAGFSQFYVAMTDDLMRRFGGERLAGLMDRLGVAEEEAIEHKQMSKSVENAQKRIEGFHFDARKHVVQYDDVMNVHREKIYARRRDLLHAEMGPEMVEQLLDRVAASLVESYAPTPNPDPSWDTKELIETVNALHQGAAGIFTLEDTPTLTQTKVREAVDAFFATSWQEQQARIPETELERVVRYVYLRSIDQLWIEHLNTMTSLRDRVALSGYAQKDPVMEYKREAYNLFKRLLGRIERTALANLMRVRVQRTQPLPVEESPYAKGQTNAAEINRTLENTGEYDLQKKNPYRNASTGGARQAPQISRRQRRAMGRKKK